MLLTFTSKAKSKLISVMNQQNCNKILFTLKMEDVMDLNISFSLLLL